MVVPRGFASLHSGEPISGSLTSPNKAALTTLQSFISSLGSQKALGVLESERPPRAMHVLNSVEHVVSMHGPGKNVEAY